MLIFKGRCNYHLMVMQFTDNFFLYPMPGQYYAYI
jgi:hypothetical protein